MNHVHLRFSSNVRGYRLVLLVVPNNTGCYEDRAAEHFCIVDYI